MKKILKDTITTKQRFRQQPIGPLVVMSDEEVEKFKKDKNITIMSSPPSNNCMAWFSTISFLILIALLIAGIILGFFYVSDTGARLQQNINILSYEIALIPSGPAGGTGNIFYF
jgi:hypothetical protein